MKFIWIHLVHVAISSTDTGMPLAELRYNETINEVKVV